MVPKNIDKKIWKFKFLKILKISIFSKNNEKLNFEQMGSFFEWFWTCGQQIIFRKFWKFLKFSIFLEKVVFSLKTVGIQWFCVFYRVERKMLISAISRINSNLHVSIFVFFKNTFFLVPIVSDFEHVVDKYLFDVFENVRICIFRSKTKKQTNKQINC